MCHGEKWRTSLRVLANSDPNRLLARLLALPRRGSPTSGMIDAVLLVPQGGRIQRRTLPFVHYSVSPSITASNSSNPILRAVQPSRKMLR